MLLPIPWQPKIQQHDTQLGHYRSWASAIALVLTLCNAPVNASYAQGSDAQRRAAIAEAVDQAGGAGKVISVKPYKQSDGKPGFRVRILIDGHVRTFDVPARAQ